MDQLSDQPGAMDQPGDQPAAVDQPGDRPGAMNQQRVPGSNGGARQMVSPATGVMFHDGLGPRRRGIDEEHGDVEICEVAPDLATANGEQAIRAHAARLASIDNPGLQRVHRIDRDGDRLRVVAAPAEGVRLLDLVHALDSGALELDAAQLLALAASVVRAVAGVHRRPGGFTHGAITPAHIVFALDGSVTLTDAVYGGAIEGLQRNREQLWREFGVALPAAANAPRFDRRGDVTQLGAVVLAILLHRPLRADEYPRPTADLVIPAASAVPASASTLAMWLQQALQLHPRASFASALEAEAAFEDIPGVGRRASAPLVIRRFLGQTDEPRVTAPIRAVAPRGGDAGAPGPTARGFTLLRAMLPHLRSN